jgi:putative phosphoribosyl transferase
MNQLNNIYFKNREVASYRLLDVLPIDKLKLEEWIVIATSYGGYLIAREVAKELGAYADIMFTSKIYASANDECEIAIVTEGEEVVLHEELVKTFDISLDLIYGQSRFLYENQLSSKVKEFRNEKKLDYLKDRNILFVDEGLNTSLTMMACIKTVINQGAKSISVALPIIPSASVQSIESIADDLYYINKLDHFVSIDFYYDELEEVTLEDIKKLKKEDK